MRASRSRPRSSPRSWSPACAIASPRRPARRGIVSWRSISWATAADRCTRAWIRRRPKPLPRRNKGAVSALVFKNRGAILALGALLLVIFGRPALGRALCVGIVLAVLGELLRIWAVGYSGVTTRANHVTAPALVTAGPYAYVRNPLYVGNFVTAAGFTLAFVSGMAAGPAITLAVIVLGLMVVTYAVIIPYEEAFLAHAFGGPFAAYVRAVPRIIPRAPKSPGQGVYRSEVIWRAETRTFVTFAVVLVILAVRLWVQR
ncbi:isoprenylcysteine carboxylmethyltransferase family protein [bacterium]|nr:MAG: isoprenylcysteine carboxylmethyltransferase family protein [bacterium]